MHQNNLIYILAIDLGTSGSKTALVSVYGEIIDFDFQKVPLNLLPNGGAEQNPDDWWNAIMTTSKRLIGKNLISPDDIAAISCTAQWSGTVAVDRNGDHLMNAVIWMDSRGAEPLEKIIKGPVNVAGYDARKIIPWIRLTGGAPAQSGKDPVAHILFIKNEYPDIYNKTYKFLEPKDYINLRLTGEYAASFDSITLHWVTDNRDVSNVSYHDKLLKMAKLDREKLPDLKRSIDILGTIKEEVAKELGLRKDTKVVLGSPDVPSAAIGSGAVRDFEGHIYIGTSSWILAHVPFKKTDIFHNIASIPCSIPGRYVIANEQETAGASLTFLRDNILYHKDELLKEEKVPHVYQIFDRIAEKVPAGSHNVIFTPWLYGERTPVENHLMRAGLYNLSLENTREDIIRAFLEGVAYNQKWVLKYVEKFIGRKMDPINMIGGGANSDVWCQIHADVLDRTIKQVEDPIQANARGAAFIALVGLGYINFDDIPKYIKIKQVYKPNPGNREVYDKLFKEFLNIYKKNSGIYRRLNKGLKHINIAR
ncbi:MAG: FGGY-family carbohydrate kinase [Deltaproteobacteria bacterium]|nr:FGGY-family carbohydrate kinase [Deltaproteobacteria bacterium]MBW2050700.1 FGGY-family carbohydrate kinase [Deltaproteobacteria bacterium]MBW2141438.1 FGGY-family carbohydrate kinase [Deltaproteobacteria bacterium]MBW2322488.1 FGGY-family carbohydrate kinase [Deltaproteobacteria bacterium]